MILPENYPTSLPPMQPAWTPVQADELSEPSGRPFLFVDGEGAQTPDGGHAYMMLAAWSEHTQGLVLRNPDHRPLSTLQCVEWLLDLSARLKAEHKPHTLIGFGLGYDIDMIFRDLPERVATYFRRPELHHFYNHRGEPGFVPWHGYLFRQLGSQLSLSDAVHGIGAELSKHTEQDRRSLSLWDVWKFFQGSFVKALRDWRILPTDELDAMADMKGRRSAFTIADYADEPTRAMIERYCLSECRAGVALMSKLADTCRQLGYPLRRYDGAGSLASAMLKAWKIDEYMAPVPEPMREAVSCAYFGGRFEIGRHGRVHETIMQDDINSAYPAQIAKLPCLAHGEWSESTNVQRLGLYRVQWIVPDPCQWGPLPHRGKDGTITYPRTGTGWYWGSEVSSAMQLYPDATYTVLAGWTYRQDCEHVPFRSVPEVYLERQRLGKSEAGIVLKLGLNSLYGKMAQSVGNPKWANYIWAGMVTAGCRAMILDAIRAARPEHVLMVATDAVVTDRHIAELPRSTDKPLGEWEQSRAEHGLLIIQPGITISYDANDTPTYKSRGLGKKEFASHAGAVEQAWNTLGILGHFTVQTHRFVGLRTAIARGDYASRCRWSDVNETLSYFPGAKRKVPESEHLAFLSGQASRSIAPEGTDMPSQPYHRLMLRMEGFDASEFITEQPAIESELLTWVASLAT